MKMLLLLALAAVSTPVLAQYQQPESWSSDDLTRETTIERISAILADINAPYLRAAYQTNTLSEAVMRDVLDTSIREVLALRDNLASNPYVRVSSFSVGFPSGVSVEFTFPPIDEEQGE